MIKKFKNPDDWINETYLYVKETKNNIILSIDYKYLKYDFTSNDSDIVFEIQFNHFAKAFPRNLLKLIKSHNLSLEDFINKQLMAFL